MAVTDVQNEQGLRRFLNQGGFWRLLLVLVVYLAIYLGAGWLASLFDGGLDEKDLLSSVGSVFFQLTIALIAGAIVLVAFSAYMGWTREIFGRQPIYRSWWMWIAPIVVLIPIVLRVFGIEWGGMGLTW